nr:NADH dehydrogenase subunit 3 [Ixodes acutitarsus]
MKIITIFLIPFLISFLSLFMSPKNTLDKEKMSPFECGFDPFSLSRIPFSIKFFLISIIFLIFDIEIVIILPFPIMLMSKNISFIVMLTIINMMIFWGLIYEWNKSMLEWLK